MEKEGKPMAVEYGKQLTEAAGAGDIAEVKRLIKLVSVNVEEYKQSLYSKPNNNFKTPLHMAASNGHSDVVVLLLKEGADCNAVDCFDITPLHLAANFGHLNCLQALIKAGAECNVHSKRKVKAIMPWKHPRAHLQCHSSTPLHLSAENNHIECMRELILNAADYNAVDDLGRTSLFISAVQGSSDGVMVQLNCVVGKDIVSRVPANSTANTPLHACVQNQMTECVVELLKHGADANTTNQLLYSPLLLACRHFNFDMVKAIVLNAYNLDMNRQRHDDNINKYFTPLHYVSFAERCEGWERHPKISEFLLAFGADGNICNIYKEHLMLRELVRDPPDFTIINALIGTLKTLPRLQDMVMVCRVPRWYFFMYQSNRNLEQFMSRQRAYCRYNAMRVSAALRTATQAGDGSSSSCSSGAGSSGNNNSSCSSGAGNSSNNNSSCSSGAGSSGSNNSSHDLASDTSLDQRLQSSFGWYEDVCREPRSLKVLARIAVREALTPNRLNLVGQLRFPAAIKEFILLDWPVPNFINTSEDRN